MKRIIVTDTHLGFKKSSAFYLNVVHNLFKDICTYAEENDIQEFIHLGDFFTNRKSISLSALATALDIGKLLEDTFATSWLLAGNHDLFYKDQYHPSSLQLFERFEGIELVYNPTLIRGDIYLVPWLIEGTDIDLSPHKYCFGHFEINGAKMNVSGITARDKAISFGDFKNYQMTLSGHFHTPGDYDNNVKYIGAPYHMDFNDSGPRGFYVHDDETGEFEFVEWKGYPKFVKWVAKPDNVFGGEFKGQVVKIIFEEDYGTSENNKIIQQVQATEPHQLFTEYKFSSGMTEEVVSDDVSLMGPREIHRDYLDKSEIPPHLNATLITRIVDQMYEDILK